MRIKDRFRRLFGIDGERAAEHHMDPDEPETDNAEYAPRHKAEGEVADDDAR